MASKPKPYVYRCEHKETKRFYIGYRTANKLPASDDLGIHYFTSSKEVKKDFHNYIFEILSEYDSALMAFEVEQRLIYECRHNELLINKNFKVRNLIEVDPKPAWQNRKIRDREDKEEKLKRDILKKEEILRDREEKEKLGRLTKQGKILIRFLKRSAKGNIFKKD